MRKALGVSAHAERKNYLAQFICVSGSWYNWYRKYASGKLGAGELKRIAAKFVDELLFEYRKKREKDVNTKQYLLQ